MLAGWLAPGYSGLPVAAAGTNQYRDGLMLMLDERMDTAPVPAHTTQIGHEPL